MPTASEYIVRLSLPESLIITYEKEASALESHSKSSSLSTSARLVLCLLRRSL